MQFIKRSIIALALFALLYIGFKVGKQIKSGKPLIELIKKQTNIQESKALKISSKQAKPSQSPEKSQEYLYNKSLQNQSGDVDFKNVKLIPKSHSIIFHSTTPYIQSAPSYSPTIYPSQHSFTSRPIQTHTNPAKSTTTYQETQQNTHASAEMNHNINNKTRGRAKIMKQKARRKAKSIKQKAKYMRRRAVINNRNGKRREGLANPPYVYGTIPSAPLSPRNDIYTHTMPPTPSAPPSPRSDIDTTSSHSSLGKHINPIYAGSVAPIPSAPPSPYTSPYNSHISNSPIPPSNQNTQSSTSSAPSNSTPPSISPDYIPSTPRKTPSSQRINNPSNKSPSPYPPQGKSIDQPAKQKMDYSATRIQAIFRGKRSRKEVAKIRSTSNNQIEVPNTMNRPTYVNDFIFNLINDYMKFEGKYSAQLQNNSLSLFEANNLLKLAQTNKNQFIDRVKKHSETVSQISTVDLNKYDIEYNNVIKMHDYYINEVKKIITKLEKELSALFAHYTLLGKGYEHQITHASSVKEIDIIIEYLYTNLDQFLKQFNKVSGDNTSCCIEQYNKVVGIHHDYIKAAQKKQKDNYATKIQSRFRRNKAKTKFDNIKSEQKNKQNNENEQAKDQEQNKIATILQAALRSRKSAAILAQKKESQYISEHPLNSNNADFQEIPQIPRKRSGSIRSNSSGSKSIDLSYSPYDKNYIYNVIIQLALPQKDEKESEYKIQIQKWIDEIIKNKEERNKEKSKIKKDISQLTEEMRKINQLIKQDEGKIQNLKQQIGLNGSKISNHHKIINSKRNIKQEKVDDLNKKIDDLTQTNQNLHIELNTKNTQLIINKNTLEEIINKLSIKKQEQDSLQKLINQLDIDQFNLKKLLNIKNKQSRDIALQNYMNNHQNIVRRLASKFS